MKANNELIADFLGYTRPNPDHPNTSYWYKDGQQPLTILLFDTNWDWLMLAIEKILDISIELDSMEMYYNITDSIPNKVQTYEAIIEFIKYYNNLKNL